MKLNWSHNDGKLKETNWIKHINMQNTPNPRRSMHHFQLTSLDFLPSDITSLLASHLNLLGSCNNLNEFGSNRNNFLAFYYQLITEGKEVVPVAVQTH